MERNVGNIDRIIRVVVGLVLLWVWYAYPEMGAWRWLVLILGLIGVVTGVLGNCLIYKLLGMNTASKE